MAFCGAFLKVLVYILVAFVAVLAYFHLECQNEEEAVGGKSKFDPFNPKQTDVKDVTLGFCKKGDVEVLDIGLDYILVQSAPCAVMKLVKFLGGGADLKDTGDKKGFVNVTIHDARKKSPGTFHETGFTLIELDKEPVTKDWRTPGNQNEDADVRKFYEQMEPHIKKLYPDAKRIEWTHNVVRGGDKFGDQPRALGPHLDYYQDDAARLEFHKDRPPVSPAFSFMPKTESQYLMGERDDDDSKLGALLGIWKPISASKVCDFPLAVMDARNVKSDELCPVKNSINFGFFTFNNLASGIVNSPEQNWYYYSFQNSREVLVFHQYSRDKLFANPHTSFFNKNCPEDTEPRISVELRLALFF